MLARAYKFANEDDAIHFAQALRRPNLNEQSFIAGWRDGVLKEALELDMKPPRIILRRQYWVMSDAGLGRILLASAKSGSVVVAIQDDWPDEATALSSVA